MGAVIDMFGDVNAAWDAYAAKARLLEADTGLLSNRQFCEELARLHERWRIMFLRSERVS